MNLGNDEDEFEFSLATPKRRRIEPTPSNNLNKYPLVNNLIDDYTNAQVCITFIISHIYFY